MWSKCLTLKCHFGLNRPTFATNMDCSDYNLQVMDVNEKTYKIDIDVLALTSFSGWLNVSQNNKTGSTLSGEIPAILLVHTTVLCGPLRVSRSASGSGLGTRLAFINWGLTFISI